MKDDEYGIIYKVTNKINQKVYIGRTVQGLYRRKWSHESKTRKSSNDMVFTRALKKYGLDNFTWDIIERCNSKEELNEMEFHYIKQYKSFEKEGYNATLGGEGSEGYKHTKEVCEAIRKRKTGVKLSTESIIKRSALQSYTWKIIYPEGKTEIIRNLARFCKSNDFGLNPGSMSAVARGVRKHHKGFRCQKMSKRSKHMSKETRQKVSVGNLGKKLTEDQIRVRTKAQSKFWLVKLPTGEELKIQNLKGYCREKGLTYAAMCRISRGERKTHRGGYSCIKLYDRK